MLNYQNRAFPPEIQTIRVCEVARQDYKLILSLLRLLRRAQ